MSNVEKPDWAAWVALSNADIRAATLLVDGDEYDTVYFHWQQAIEKRIKAVIVRGGNPDPPKIHSLVELAHRAALELTEDHEALLFDLTQLYIETRYPVSALVDSDLLTCEHVHGVASRVKEVLEWLDQLLTPNE